LRFTDWVRRWPPALRRRLEWITIACIGVIVLVFAFRQPMSDRIYPEARSADALGARAYAEGNEIFFGRGRFAAEHDHYDVMPAHLVDKVKRETKDAD